MNKPLLAAACLVNLSVVLSLPAVAGEGFEDPKRGLRLAQTLCVNCHDVSRNERNTRTERVPSFRSLANAPEQSRERLAGRIVIPHPEMPTIPLTRTEIRDIVSYIMSLKSSEQ